MASVNASHEKALEAEIAKTEKAEKEVAILMKERTQFAAKSTKEREDAVASAVEKALAERKVQAESISAAEKAGTMEEQEDSSATKGEAARTRFHEGPVTTADVQPPDKRNPSAGNGSAVMVPTHGPSTDSAIQQLKARCQQLELKLTTIEKEKAIQLNQAESKARALTSDLSKRMQDLLLANEELRQQNKGLKKQHDAAQTDLLRVKKRCNAEIRKTQEAQAQSHKLAEELRRRADHQVCIARRGKSSPVSTVAASGRIDFAFSFSCQIHQQQFLWVYEFS